MNNRQRFLRQHLDIARLDGLEIGGLDRPLVPPASIDPPGRIRFADHLDTDGLKEKYAADPAVDTRAIVPVSFVVQDQTLADAVADARFDYVVASHVIEHVPDLIGWLGDIFGLLKPGGHLYLVVPDKRFTFDHRRPVSTPGQFVAAHLAGRKTPDPGALFDHFALATANRPHQMWQGDFEDGAFDKPGDVALALNAAREGAQGRYIDTHVSAFTPASFFQALKILIDAGLVDFEVAAFEDTREMALEFLVLLRRPVTDDRAARLATVPEIVVDSLEAHRLAQVRNSQQAVRALTGEVHALTDQLREVSDRLHEANLRLHHLDGELADERAGHAHARARIEHLQAEAAQLRGELEQTRRSTSWRVTAPLRALVEMFRG